MKRVYHGFGGKLHHDVPSWVRDDAIFHIRIRCDRGQATPITTPEVAQSLLDSARFYEARGRWWLDVFVIMPDHIHILASFPPDGNMGTVIGDWKRYHVRKHGIRWQENFFEHRVRDYNSQWQEQREYILQNPVVLGLCAKVEEWPWKYENGDGRIETRPDQRGRE